MTKEIVAMKRDLRMKAWSRQIEDCSSSGMTVQKWCEQNGISPKSYYYHLRKVREACLEEEQVVVPLGKSSANDKIEVNIGELNMSLPINTDVNTICSILQVLKNA